MSIRYIVCSIPRCGSGYLCSMLSQTGRAGMVPVDRGHGWEYLLPHRLAALGAEGRDFPDQLQRAFAFGTTPNGVQGFKVVWAHFGRLYARDKRKRAEAQAELNRFLSREVHWIYLERRDELAQAVSWARATQTGRWNVLAGRREGPAAQYNYLLIRYKLWSIEKQRRAWRRFFAELGVRPLNLVYEDYVTEPLQTLTRIGDYLDIPEPLSLPSAETSVRKQRDQVNQRWKDRFLEDDSGWPRRIAAAIKTPFLRSSWAAVHRALAPGR